MVQTNNSGSVYRRLINAIDKHFKYIVWALIGIQMLKGTALYEHAYARSQYLWSYDAGFIKRGLIGTITMFLNEGSDYRILGIINFLSYLFYFLFIYLLYRFILKNAGTIMQKMVAILFLASPFLIAIGSLLGYFDSLILSMLIIIYNFCDRENIPVLPFLLCLTITIMIHEMSFFFVVLPLLYFVWMHSSTSQKRKYYLTSTTILLCIIYIIIISRQNAGFLKILDERVVKYEHVLSTKTGQKFFEFYADYAIKNGFMQDFKILRLGMLVVLLPVYGFFILLTNWIVIKELFFKKKKLADTLLYMAACYAPLAIIIVGWDVDRFVCLGIFTSYIAFVVVSKSCNIISTNEPKQIPVFIASIICIIALLTYYPISGNYAEAETLLSMDKQKILFQYPEKLITSWKKLVVPKKNRPIPSNQNIEKNN